MDIISIDKQYNDKMISDYRKVKRGKSIVIIIIAINCLYSLKSFIAFIESYDSVTFLKELLMLAFTGIISYLFYNGLNFAKWMSLALIVPPVLAVVFYFFRLIKALGLLGGWFMLIVTIILGIGGGILLGREESLNIFLEEQERNRTWFKKAK